MEEGNRSSEGGSERGPIVALSQGAIEGMERFRVAHETRILTILFSDLEGSTHQQTELGNIRARDLVNTHQQIFRDALTGLDGQEVSTAGDSFLVVFASPSMGIRFALYMQAVMRRAKERHPGLLPVRVGLHQGEVVVERRADSAAIADIYGIQVSTAARIAGLGTGGQTLCSRAVFDDARAILGAEELRGLGALAWVNHGAYRFKGVDQPYDVCEVGEADHAPLAAPPGDGKGWPAGASDEELGWRPAAGVVLPGTDWELLEKLGQGEFGEVWLARNPSSGERKVCKFCFKRERVAWLKREARVLAELKRRLPGHPNIATLGDVMTGGDRPPYYLTMEYVEGPALDDWLTSSPSLGERLELMAQVADALDAVHAEGIWHRDVKPTNILLTRRGDGSLQAKLTDFGLAAAEDEQLLASVAMSRVDAVIGTWDYLAPELRDGRRASAQSDIYSLGVVLYQVVLCDLRRPLTGDWQACVESEILRDDIGRCIAADPAKRWQRAGQIALALRSHEQRLRERRLAAERQRQHARATRLAVVASLAALIAVLMIGFGGYAWIQRAKAERLALSEGHQRRAAEASRLVAEEARLTAHVAQYHTAITLAAVQVSQGDTGLVPKLLLTCPEHLRDWEWGYLLGFCDFEEERLTCHGKMIQNVAFSRDGQFLAISSGDGVELWDVGRRRAIWNRSIPRASLLCFHPTNACLLVWSGGSFQMLQVMSGDHLGTSEKIVPGIAPGIYDMCFGAGGDTLFVATRGSGQLLEMDTRDWLVKRRSPERDQVAGLGLSSDGKVLVVGFAHGGLFSLRDAVTREAVWELDGDLHAVDGLKIVMDRDRLVYNCAGSMRVWDTKKRELVRSLFPQHQTLGGLVVVPQTDMFLAGSEDATIKAFRLSDAEEVWTIRTDSPVKGLALVPGRSTVVSVHGDATIRFWSPNAGQDKARRPVWIAELGENGTGVSFSTDGKGVCLNTFSAGAFLWDSDELKPTLRINASDVSERFGCYRPNTREVGVSYPDCIKFHDDRTGAVVREIKVRGPVKSFGYGRSGRMLAVAYESQGRQDLRGVDLIDINKISIVATLPEAGEPSVSFSPDEATVAVGSKWSPRVSLYSVVTRTKTGEVTVPEGEGTVSLDFSPTGVLLAGGGKSGNIYIWDVSRMERVKMFSGCSGYVGAVRFSKSGKRLFSGSHDRTLSVWDWDNERTLLTFQSGYFVLGADIDSDGRRLASSGSVRDSICVREALPWRLDEYPGDDTMSFPQRVSLYQRQRGW